MRGARERERVNTTDAFINSRVLFTLCAAQKINFDAHMLVLRFNRVLCDALCIPFVAYTRLKSFRENAIRSLFIVCTFDIPSNWNTWNVMPSVQMKMMYFLFHLAFISTHSIVSGQIFTQNYHCGGSNQTRLKSKVWNKNDKRNEMIIWQNKNKKKKERGRVTV